MQSLDTGWSATPAPPSFDDGDDDDTGTDGVASEPVINPGNDVVPPSLDDDSDVVDGEVGLKNRD